VKQSVHAVPGASFHGVPPSVLCRNQHPFHCCPIPAPVMVFVPSGAGSIIANPEWCRL
jgi:hypothetical protein